MIRGRLQHRILLLVLAVIAPFAVLTFVGVERKISEEAHAKLSVELASARASFDALRQARREQLVQTARLVSELPYFKAAAAVYEADAPVELRREQVATIEPVARDIMEGMNVDFLAITDLGGRPMIALRDGHAVTEEWIAHGFRRLEERANTTGEADGCINIGGELFQVAMVPVEAGRTPLGVLTLGERLDDALAARIRRQTQVEVVILGGDRPIARCCGTADRGREMFLAGWFAKHHDDVPGNDQALELKMEGERFMTLWAPITDPDGRVVGTFILQRSLDKALAYVTSIRNLMIGTWLAAFLVALALSYLFARQLTRPIERLAGAARGIAAGDFRQEVPADGGEELSSLADAFNRMSFGIRVSHEQLAETNARLLERTRELEKSHSELEASNRELRETQAQLLQAGKMAAFGELGAGLAHELNQPLATVKGYAQLTQARLGPEEGPHHKSLALIVQAVDYMSGIVSGLRKFSRKSRFELAPASLNGIVEETARFLAPQVKRSKARLELDLDPAVPEIRADAIQLQQVIMNLVTNGLDAAEGSPDARVTLRTRATGNGRAVVSVIDNGPGIPADVRRNMFQSFFTTKTEGKGTGLGLPISRGIVENHGGKLKVRTASGRGTAFHVVLPVEMRKAA